MFNLKGLHNMFFHLLFLPLLFFIMWIFYFGMKVKFYGYNKLVIYE